MRIRHRVVLLLLALTFALGSVFPSLTHDTWNEAGHTASRCRLTGETVIQPNYTESPFWDCFSGGPPDSVFGD